MTEEDGNDIQAVWLPAFMDMVPTAGPEGAYRRLSKMAGEETARLVQKAWLKKVRIITQQAGPSTLRDRRIAHWYAGPSADDRFWPALQRHLISEKGWAAEAVTSIDQQSTNVMKLLPYPGGEVNARGLVVGYVQSGKTANYTALIAKAADVGYRLFIVLAGIHNGLRRQTQERLQAEIVYVDSKLKSEWHTLTQPAEDFRARGTNSDAFFAEFSHQRILLVVKKNVHVLGRLVSWLRAADIQRRGTCPALIIDDEADQAGLNTGKNDKRSAVNAKILELKAALPKAAYVGYTATPFANVLVDPSGDDLYPEDFIVSLDKPEGYFGTELFFGRDSLDVDESEPPPPPDMVREVLEDEVPLLRPVRGGGEFAPEIPNSLNVALRYFLMATAARWVRGHRKKHSSMLIHTALNPWVHQLLAQCVEQELARIKRGLKTNKVEREMEAIWKDEHPRVEHPGLDPVAFEQVWEQLGAVLTRTKVVEDNGQSDQRLVYKEEFHLTDEDAVAHIAIGGNTLSRGLTLEGLVVSYFIRTSSAYDTLLQMGRWFGYRFGYQDLPRIWMTRELKDAFHDLATVEEEIRRDITHYENQGLTPRQFAVRIRTHPSLAITSRLKMRHAVTAGINYTGGTRQTTKFRLDEQWLDNNWRAGAVLLDEIALDRMEQIHAGRRFFSGVPVALVMEFLAEYEVHEGQPDLARHLLVRYIDAQLKQERLKEWTVCVSALAKESDLGQASLGERSAPFNLINRSRKDRLANGVILGTMTWQADFAVGLPQDLLSTKGPKQHIKRPEGSEPLLLLYPISKDSRARDSKETLNAPMHVLGMALAFPKIPGERDTPSKVEYVQVELPAYFEEDEVVLEEDDG